MMMRSARGDAVAWLFGATGRKAAGTTGAFETQILPHLDAAYNLARWLVRDASLAEDVVQEASLRALTYIGSFAGGDPRAWLLRITRNAAYDAIAKRDRLSAGCGSSRPGASDEEEDPLERVADPSDDPEAALAHRQDQALLEAAIAALPADLRECLVLRELEALSYKEIAHVTGVPIGTVMSRLHRARQALIDGATRGARE